MKTILVLCIFCASALSYNFKCSLENSMKPLCYHARNEAKLNVSLIYYGRSMDLSDLQRIAPILKERFYKASGKNISLDIVDFKVLDFKYNYPDDFKVKDVTDPARLQRIWYYEKFGAKIMKEVYRDYLEVTDKKVVRKLDAILAITGAQFDGLGFANGRVSVTEYPQEIAWALPGGGRVRYVNDYNLVDELIHELGHNMFLGHTSTHCQKSGLTLEQRKYCCSKSPSKDDVLSYCRSRSKVSENFMHGFERCNRDMIVKKITPAILKGGNWRIKNRSKCR